MIGIWRRLVLERPGEAADTSTAVFWMQGPRFFADLRQSPESPPFDGVRCLADLAPEHLDWLATQEGFSGSFHLTDGIALWDRDIDFQPKSGIPDRAKIHLDGEYLHEEGTEAPYYEKWIRGGLEALKPARGLKLECQQTNCPGYLVRVGQSFMFARDRPEPLPEGDCLSSILRRAPNTLAKRALVDFEISLGEICSTGTWIIRRSTLPFRVAQDFALLRQSADELEIQDTTSNGRAYKRKWRIVDRDETFESQQLGNLGTLHASIPMRIHGNRNPFGTK